MFMMCLQKMLGFCLPEEDSAVFSSVLINPRMKEHRAVFRQFRSDQDWFYSIVCLHIIIHFMMTGLILPTLSSGTKDNGSGVWKHVCKSPLLMRSTLDRSKKQDPLHSRKKKNDCSFILIWKPSVLAHPQHQTSALLCFSLWKVQLWTEATR